MRFENLAKFEFSDYCDVNYSVVGLKSKEDMLYSAGSDFENFLNRGKNPYIAKVGVLTICIGQKPEILSYPTSQITSMRLQNVLSDSGFCIWHYIATKIAIL